MRTVKPLVGAFVLCNFATAQPHIPKTWDESALADWAMPLAGLNARPTHMSEKEYYALPTDNLRTYPVYYPGREPKGYWEMLQHIGPKPLIEREKLKTEADWIEAGRKIFDELDNAPLRTLDPKFIRAARSRETFQSPETAPLPDGTVVGMCWVPTAKGVALSFNNCSGCHLTHLPDGTRVAGAPAFAGPRAIPGRLIVPVHLANRTVPAAVPFRMGDEPLGMWLYRASSVPWAKDDVHERLKDATAEQLGALLAAQVRGGALPRWNGSLFYPTVIPDLIGLKDRKYLDATGTHQHRGIGDLMRYAAMVSSAEPIQFGPHHVLPPDATRVEARHSDELLYALALYIYSLEPPRNPNQFDEKAKWGKTIFEREGCAGCHTPPLYTNNKLTLAQGFMPSPDKHAEPGGLDVLPISVGTDPSLALKTRKATGYYKVPSIKGVWYRAHYLHDGSVASLEEMFDADRLNDTHVPGGFLPVGAKTHAIPGHEFGLHLKPAEREQLIAFLRTL